MISKLIYRGLKLLSFTYCSLLFNYIEQTNTKFTPDVVDLIQNYLKENKKRIIELVS